MKKDQTNFLRQHVPHQTLNRFLAQDVHGFRDESEERAFVKLMVETGLVEAVDTRPA